MHIQHQLTFLAAGDNRVSTFPAKKKKTNKQTNNRNATGGLMSSVSRGPANQAVYFLKYFYRRVTRKFSSSVVLDVALYYFNVPVKSKLNDPSGVFKLLAGY